MNKKVGISKIVINIGDKEAALTVEQAKELRDALNAVLGETKTVVERVIEHDRWYPHWPTVIYGTATVGHTTYSGDNGTHTINLSGGDLLPV